MHFKVELCFELSIDPPEVLMPSLLQSRRPHWGWRLGWRTGRWERGGGPVVPVVPVGLANLRFHGLDFLPGYHIGLKGEFKIFCRDPGQAHHGMEQWFLNGKTKGRHKAEDQGKMLTNFHVPDPGICPPHGGPPS